MMHDAAQCQTPSRGGDLMVNVPAGVKLFKQVQEVSDYETKAG